MRTVRCLSALAALTVTVGVLGVAVPANADVAPCPVGASLPATLAFSGSSTAFEATVSDPEGCVDWAHYQLERDDDTVAAGNIFEAGALEDRMQLYGRLDGPGRYHLVFDDGYSTRRTDDGGTAPLAGSSSDWMVAKFASKISWRSAHRSAKTVKLSAKVTSYGKSYYQFEPWRRAVVDFQEQQGDGWKTARTVRTDKDGIAGATITSTVRKWRAIVRETATVWGGTTGGHRK